MHFVYLSCSCVQGSPWKRVALGSRCVIPLTGEIIKIVAMYIKVDIAEISQPHII